MNFTPVAVSDGETIPYTSITKVPMVRTEQFFGKEPLEG